MIEGKIKGHWFLSAMQIIYLDKDIDAVATLVREQDDPCVDVHRLLPIALNPSLLLDDGLHPSITGQKAITKAVVEHLAG